MDDKITSVEKRDGVRDADAEKAISETESRMGSGADKVVITTTEKLSAKDVEGEPSTSN